MCLLLVKQFSFDNEVSQRIIDIILGPHILHIIREANKGRLGAQAKAATIVFVMGVRSRTEDLIIP